MRLATEDTAVLERQGHYSMAMVCRRSSVSTSFMLAALRVLHVDISNALGTGSLDRAKAICASEFACVGAVVLSAYISGAGFLTCSGTVLDDLLVGEVASVTAACLAWLVQCGLFGLL